MPLVLPEEELEEDETQMQPPCGPKTRGSTVQCLPVGQEPLQDGAEAEQEMPEEDEELLEEEETQMQPPCIPKTRGFTVQCLPVGQEPLQDGAEAEQEMPEEELEDELDELLDEDELFEPQ